MPALASKTRDNVALVLAPELGGAIASLKFRGVDILRPLPARDDVAANQAGCFALVPYSNRIAYGSFGFNGQRYQLAKNFGEHPHSIHGNGWQKRWQIEEESESSVVLSLEHFTDEENFRHWPWRYSATQLFELKDDALHATLSYRNQSSQAVPVGLGFHPYFANADRALLRLVAGKVLVNDENMLPVSEENVPDRWDYRQMRRPQAGSVDNCFTEWDGRAELLWPEHNIKAEISAPDARNVVLFVPPAEKNFVAIEPVTNVNNAINDRPLNAGSGSMKLVPPGESFSLTMTIKLSNYE